MDNQIIDKTVQNKVKKRRNRPDLQNFGAEYAKPGDMTKYVRAMRAGLEAGRDRPIDTSDPEAVYARICEYLEYCEENDVKPQIVALSLWLGVSRDVLNKWKHGEYRANTHQDMIKRILTGFESISVDLAMDGKVNPANLIFLLKNHFGYKDNTDIIIHPDNPLDTRSADDIAGEYGKALPEFSTDSAVNDE